jgi:hypothetical protein
MDGKRRGEKIRKSKQFERKWIHERKLLDKGDKDSESVHVILARD